MIAAPAAMAVSGTTMHWTWTAGPTTGRTHEHRFHEDGTVEWRELLPPPNVRNQVPVRTTGPDRVPYAALEVTLDVRILSYLSSEGFTLTVALDFSSHQLVGFASSATEWHPVRATFAFA